MDGTLYGYMGKVLRVDLTDGSIHDEPLEPEMAANYVGGTGFGVEYLYREVPIILKALGLEKLIPDLEKCM